MAEYIFEIGEALYDEKSGRAVFKPRYIEELVRCKDCIFFNSTWEVCNLLERVREKDGYCSIAKKKGETNARITNNL